MRSMFPQAPVALQQLLQRHRREALPPRPEERVTRPGDGIDALHLDKPDPPDEIIERLP